MPSTTRKDRRTTLTFAFLFGVVVIIVVLIAVLVTTGDSDDVVLDDGTVIDETQVEEAAQVEVAGDQLPPFNPEGQDSAIGMPMPGLSGTDISGEPVDLGADGPAAYVFLAHWCPHCRDEVPQVQELINEGSFPDEVEIRAVATGNSPSEANYPPTAWLHTEGWTPPTLVDDDMAEGAGDNEPGAAAEAAGLSGFPYWVFTDADGTVVHRQSGAIPGDALLEIMNNLAAL